MERSLEARLGVVMYGGVSLAVYENGVAQELFRAVRGHEPISGGGQKLGVYDLLKTLTDTDIVVDILSGTSAGGINGILLGYALANAKDFTRCSSLWCEDGDLMGLMRKPRDEAMNSLLDSTGVYQPALQKAFREMDKHDYGKPYGSEIDLFVTGTNVHGHVYTEFDDQGHAIDVKDHRAVFVLSYRPDRKNEFAAENIDALAKLARITSCFPIAFEPVHVSATDAADKALCRWGRLTEDAYFLDGGVLDNKPFSYAIDAIFGRLASRPVERMLLYIEPDPEHLNNEPLHEMPNVLKAATDALVAIPGYESISSDLQTIAARNSKLQKYKEVVRNILDDKEDMLSKLDSESPATKHIYLQARLSQVRDRVLSGLLKQGGQLRLLNESQRRAVRILVTSFDEFGVEGEETLRDFDVYFRLRRLHFLVCYVLQPAIHASIRVDDVYAEVLHRLNHQINLLEMIQFAAESVIDNSSIPADDLLDDRDSKTRAKEKWIAVQNLLRQVLARTDKLSTVGTREWDKSVSDESRIAQERQSRDVFMTELRRRMDELRQSNGLELKSVIGNLLEETDDQERKILERLEPKQGQLFDLSDEERKLRKRIPDAYRHFKHIDAYLFPLEELGTIGCKDQIRTVRISPNDSRFGIGKDKNVKGKLCGRLLGHFAGFLKRSWRVNDIMWGRLDAVSQVIPCILTAERVGVLVSKKAPIVEAIGRYDLPAMFPSSTACEIRELKQGLACMFEYADEHIKASARGEKQTMFAQLVERIITAAQREIIAQEVPKLIEAAIEQQVHWNNYKVRSKNRYPFVASAQSWQLGVRQIDSAILRVARRALSAPQPNRYWVEFLDSSDYPVAKETVEGDIPKSVLLEMGAQAGLVLQNCLTGALGKDLGEKVRSNGVFRTVCSIPLNAIYRFASFQRTAPEFARVGSAVLAAVCLSLLTIGCLWWNPIIMASTGAFAMNRFLALLAGPAIILVALMAYHGVLRWVLAALSIAGVTALSLLGLLHHRLAELSESGGRLSPWLASLAEQIVPMLYGAIGALLVGLPLVVFRRDIRALMADEDSAADSRQAPVAGSRGKSR